MSTRITAAAHLDEEMLSSSGGAHVVWRDVGLAPERGTLRFQPIFDAPLPGFRRMDLTSRVLLVAAEALALDRHLPREDRRETAIVLATSTGCLAADARFQRGLATPGRMEPSLFPYTLPSTCLGEIAIHHRLQGPTLCVSVEPGDEAWGVLAARDLIDAGEAPAAVVLLGDWVPIDSEHPSKTRVAALLLDGRDTDTPGLASLSRVLADPFTVTRALSV